MPAIILNPTPSPSQMLAIWTAAERMALDVATHYVACGEISLSEHWMQDAARSRVQTELWAQAA